MSETWRLFLALDLPRAVLDDLAKVQRTLKRSGADVRWVGPESIHLTVKFLGETDSDKVKGITSVAESAARACPTLTLTPAGVGCFPGLGQPRVVWAGLLGDVEPLKKLAFDLEVGLEPLGFAPEGRPFSPHLTLGRVKSGRNRSELGQAVAQLANWRGQDFTVSELTLFRSQLKPTGPIYTALAKTPLSDH